MKYMTPLFFLFIPLIGSCQNSASNPITKMAVFENKIELGNDRYQEGAVTHSLNNYRICNLIIDNQENSKKIKNIEMNKNNQINKVTDSRQDSSSYSIIIDIFRKGNYKKYSYRLVNNNFEALQFSLNSEPKSIISRNLTLSEAKEFEQYLFSFPLEQLDEEYSNSNVKGNYHLIYEITIGEKKKSIYVYFERQKDLAELYNSLSNLIPVNDRFLYYRE